MLCVFLAKAIQQIHNGKITFPWAFHLPLTKIYIKCAWKLGNKICQKNLVSIWIRPTIICSVQESEIQLGDASQSWVIIKVNKYNIKRFRPLTQNIFRGIGCVMNNQKKKKKIYLRMQLDISLPVQLHHEQIFWVYGK